MTLRLLAPALLLLGLAGCDGTGQMTPTTQRVGGGAAVGALTGLAIGSISGNAGTGALIGAAAGGVGGFAWDQHQRAQQRAFNQGVAAGRASSQ
ncbi:glycine zipper domain-containing protein [Sediminicoccus rosea]|jgi:uncharacterized membrane protein YebE (DUF533 family)|uniref:Glycine zipper domain-containing protein n=1 Tax=Sediminicoccus rosea TaxID=1225128 RepID=A0ABZ0PN97_9PROT|nr:glycine zipper domain-containing protein [Sediminicoccus rosea]WPB86691.1 glycine zipper domain-containing protein [Sediminicoccus rosea]